jgi:hypothetical protein
MKSARRRRAPLCTGESHRISLIISLSTETNNAKFILSKRKNSQHETRTSRQPEIGPCFYDVFLVVEKTKTERNVKQRKMHVSGERC